MLKVRNAEANEIEIIMSIYRSAQDFMIASGNPNQWGPTNWPPMDLLRQDIADGNSYVCEHDGRVVGTFFYIYGHDIEPTYREIMDGAWRDDEPFGVVHRLAGDGSVRGIGEFCLNWAFDQSGHLRVDTHTDNVVMQKLLEKLGFRHMGTIYVVEDDYPRYAYEK